ncbi:MAG TPA: DivIVA domain-containing protein [Actinomycetes bacterium]|nr:DivIVA domain-containing protein [Actinomycetes bacterium]
MSAFEADRVGESTSGARNFQTAMRGYDRQQVDQVVGDLVEQLEQERQRSEETTRALYKLQRDSKTRASQPSFVNLGEEAAKVLEQAGTAAEKLLGEAAARAQAIVDAAEQKAEDRIGEAEEHAAELEAAARQTLEDSQAERAQLEADAADTAEQVRSQAEQEAKAVVAEALDEARLAWQKAERKRLLVETETERLAMLRQVTIEQLGRVRSQLGLALLETEAEFEDDEEERGAVRVAQAANGGETHREPAAPQAQAQGERPSAEDGEAGQFQQREEAGAAQHG